MKNYVFIYYNGAATGDMPMEEVRAAWGAWFGQLGDAVVDAGHPFQDGGKVVMADSVVDAKGQDVTGYSIVKADDFDAALALAQSCPILKHLKDAGVGVYEALPM
jgi:hypothetical protein